MTPGEVVSREAARVEQDLMIGLLETAVRNNLYAPFQVDALWYEPDFRTYRVKLRVAGKDENGKTISLVFTGSITEEAIGWYANDVPSWKRYMEISVRAWITRMSQELSRKGATRLLVGGRKKTYMELSSSVDDLSKKIDAFEAATKQMGANISQAAKSFDAIRQAWDQKPAPWQVDRRALSSAERKSLMESLKQSAERQTS